MFSFGVDGYIGVKQHDKNNDGDDDIYGLKTARPVAASCKETTDKGKQRLTEHKSRLMEAHDLVLQRVGRDEREHRCVGCRYNTCGNAHKCGAGDDTGNGELNICNDKARSNGNDEADYNKSLAVEFCEQKRRSKSRKHHNHSGERCDEYGYAVLAGKSGVNIAEDDSCKRINVHCER